MFRLVIQDSLDTFHLDGHIYFRSRLVQSDHVQVVHVL